MAKPSKPNIPPLPPLEYCRVERAARLLGCEVDDIYHWATERTIRLYVNFGFRGTSAVIAASKDEPISYSSRHIVNRMASYSAFEPNPFEYEYTDKVDVSDDPHADHGIAKFIDAFLFGLWAVHPKGIQEIYLGFDDLPYPWRRVVSARNGESGEIVIAQFDDDEYPDLWVMGSDLRLLHEHIYTGEPLPIITSTKRNEPSKSDYIRMDELESADIEEKMLDMFARGKQRAQEEQILSTLKAKGISSKELQKNQPGKKGVKAVVRGELTKLKPAMFTVNSFDKAWERLLRDGRIAYL